MLFVRAKFNVFAGTSTQLTLGDASYIPRVTRALSTSKSPAMSRVVIRSMLPLQYAAQPRPSTSELGGPDGEYFANGGTVDMVMIRVYPLFLNTGIYP
jgi:hypothetical protein